MWSSSGSSPSSSRSKSFSSISFSSCSNKSSLASSLVSTSIFFGDVFIVDGGGDMFFCTCWLALLDDDPDELPKIGLPFCNGIEAKPGGTVSCV